MEITTALAPIRPVMREPGNMRLLVACQGEIALRVMEAARETGFSPVTVYTVDQVHLGEPPLYVLGADTAIAVRELGGLSPAQQIAVYVQAAQKLGAKYVHPGYGMLAENPDFARQCAQAGLIWAGPSPAALEHLGRKDKAQQLADELELPTIPTISCNSAAAPAPPWIGSQPTILKTVDGGGGWGSRLLASDASENDFTRAVTELATQNDHDILASPLLSSVSHVEVQVICAPSHANTQTPPQFDQPVAAYASPKNIAQMPPYIAKAIGTRDCSLQLDRQKVIELAPALISQALTEKLFTWSTRLIEAAQSPGVFTVEWLVTPDERAYFLEVNPRLQVEHRVTELTANIDLVKTQLLLACGATWSDKNFPPPNLFASCAPFALEARLNSTDPASDFLPTPGVITDLRWPKNQENLLIDSGVAPGSFLTSQTYSLIAKLVATGASLPQVITRLHSALHETQISGIATTRDFLLNLLDTLETLTNTSLSWPHTTWLTDNLTQITVDLQPFHSDPNAEDVLNEDIVSAEIGGICTQILAPRAKNIGLKHPDSAAVFTEITDVSTPLVLLETMKMQIAIYAPNPGIYQLFIKPGDSVAPGQIIAEIANF